MVWVRLARPERLQPVVLGGILNKCGWEFIPLFTSLLTEIPNPHSYHLCCDHIIRLLNRAELLLLTAHPKLAELTYEALLEAHPWIVA